MSHDKLISMANQMAGFFNTQRGDDQAERLAAHINDFWAPEMRAQLIGQLEADDTCAEPLVRAAVASIRVPA